jgi:hypothetical protein
MPVVEVVIQARLREMLINRLVEVEKVIGPPIVPPNWLRLNSGLPIGSLSKKLRASILSLRRNS